MDTLTTGLLAGTLGVAALRRRAGVAGAWLFTIAAVAPDADGLFGGGRLDYIRSHRGTTHSFVGAAAGALILAGAARLVGVRTRFATLFGCAAAGWIFHLGTDLVTWWGTQVLSPFQHARLGVGLVFILDFWLAAFALAPFVAWGVAQLRGEPLPERAFRIASGFIAAYMALVVAMRIVALDALGDLCRARGCTAETVLPQPFSPFRWSLVADEGDGWRMVFVDLLRGNEPVDERFFPRPSHPAIEVVDATDEGRTLRWFHRLEWQEVRDLGAGRTEVVFRDAAYEMWPKLRDGSPFAYRFVVEGARVVEHGFAE